MRRLDVVHILSGVWLANFTGADLVHDVLAALDDLLASGSD